MKKTLVQPADMVQTIMLWRFTAGEVENHYLDFQFASSEREAILTREKRLVEKLKASGVSQEVVDSRELLVVETTKVSDLLKEMRREAATQSESKKNELMKEIVATSDKDLLAQNLKFFSKEEKHYLEDKIT